MKKLAVVMISVVIFLLVFNPAAGSNYPKIIKASEMPYNIPTGYSIKSLFDRSELGDDYPYDIDTIKNMTLNDLNWTVQDIDGDGNATWQLNYTSPDGQNKTITVIEGTFGGKDSLGGDTYTMVPREYLMKGEVNHTKTIHLLHGAILLLPDGYPNCTGLGYGVFVNTHGVPSLQDAEIRMLSTLVVDTYDVPILLAGEYPQNWESFNFTGGQDEILYPSVVAAMLTQNFSASAMKMVYMYPLLRMNLMAHTLFCRLVEQYGGNMDKGIFSEGASKQGFVRWFVGMLDDRVAAIFCDNMQLEDILNASKRYYWDWGLPPIQNSSSGDWANYSNQIATILINLGESYQCGYDDPSSPYRLMYDVWDINANRHLLKNVPFIGINGGIGGGYYENGEYKLSHDGTYFPLGAESEFLKKLNELGVEWRYGREQTKHALGYSDSVPLNESRYLCNVASGLYMMIYENMDFTRWQKVEDVNVSLHNYNSTYEYLNVTARIKYPQANMSVVFWYAANSDRRWNDPEHTSGIYRWRYVNMTPINSTTYKTSVIIRKDLMYGYYVEASVYCMDLPYIGKIRKFDGSPVEFIHEYPPASPGSSDIYVGNLTTYPSNPLPGENVQINITVKADRVKIWYAGAYPSPPLTNIGVRVEVDSTTIYDGKISLVNETTISLSWVAGSEGFHQLKVILDYNNTLAEKNETNNNFVYNIPVGNVSQIKSEALLLIAIPLILEVLRRFRN